MSDGLPFFDIILFAMIAAGLVTNLEGVRRADRIS